MRHASFQRKQRIDTNMLNSFTKTFEPPSRTVVAIGDYGTNRAMMHQEPTIGKSTRDLFHRRGYTILLIDEHKTSKMRAACGSECAKSTSLLETRNHRPCRRAIATAAGGDAAAHVQQYPYIVHGLLKCTGCSRYWNRDVNGALNILKAVRAAANNEIRP